MTGLIARDRAILSSLGKPLGNLHKDKKKFEQLKISRCVGTITPLLVTYKSPNKYLSVRDTPTKCMHIHRYNSLQHVMYNLSTTC